MERETEKRINKAVLRTLAYIKKNTPVKTSNLRNSIVVNKTETGFIIGTNTKYAEHVEIGVRPHKIEPKNKKALYWKGARHPVKSVMHPGFDGRLMFYKGSKMFEKFLKQELSK